MTNERILIIDDEKGMCKLLKTILHEEGFDVETVSDPLEGLRRLGHGNFDLLVTDLKMPKMSGLEVMKKARQQVPGLAVIVITAYGTVETAIEAMKHGAGDYVQKPFQNEEFTLAVHNVLEKNRLRQENARLKMELSSGYKFDNIIGRSKRMQDIFRLLARLSENDTTVLVLGESGTGKELAARALHYNGTRKNEPFVVVNCSALPENLLESELFGHVKGAFTDALRDHAGLLETADGGTVFFDEIGDMPLALQVKLLRFLQEREIKPVGGVATKKLNVRVIAATNRDLSADVKNKRFREDLYYRLSVVPVRLPPLRERKDDLPILVRHFIEKLGKKLNKTCITLSPDIFRRLDAYDWPGNIRELENVIEHMLAVSDTACPAPEDLPPDILGANGILLAANTASMSYRDAKKEALDIFERAYLSVLMDKTRGNISQAAQIADMDRKNLQEILKNHPAIIEKYRGKITP